MATYYPQLFAKAGKSLTLDPVSVLPGETKALATVTFTTTGRADRLRVELPPDLVGVLEYEARFQGVTPWTRVDTEPGLAVTDPAGTVKTLERRVTGVARSDAANYRRVLRLSLLSSDVIRAD